VKQAISVQDMIEAVAAFQAAHDDVTTTWFVRLPSGTVPTAWRGGGAIAETGGVWRADAECVAATGYSAAWADRYAAARHQHVDPVMRRALSGFGPFDWRTLDWTSDGAVAFRREATAHGVEPWGVTIPIHGADGCVAAISLNAPGDESRWDALADRAIGPAMMVGAVLQERLHAALAAAPELQRPCLTARQRDVLGWLSVGLDIAAIAERLRLSPSTVRGHLAQARTRLGARSTPHAVAIGVQRGLIADW
jgi:LuxR family transcriptional activator of conjugal transfer of Ti plasmids